MCCEADYCSFCWLLLHCNSGYCTAYKGIKDAWKPKLA